MGIRVGDTPPSIFDQNPYDGTGPQFPEDFREDIRRDIEQEEDDSSLLESAGSVAWDAIQAEQFIPNAGRWFSDPGPADTDFELTEDVFDTFVKGMDPVTDPFEVPSEYRDLAGHAVSQEHLMQMRDTIRDDVERDHRLAEAGVPGVLARMASIIVDPVAIGAAVGGNAVVAPFLTAWKATRLQRAIGGAVAGAASNAAAEAALSTVNPKLGWSDIAVAAAAGSVLGGTIGALRRNRLTQTEADELNRIGTERLRQEMGSTVGAAQNPNFRSSILDSSSFIEREDVTRPAFGMIRPDVSARIGQEADAPAAQVVGRALLGDPVGAAGDEVVDVGAVSRMMRRFEAKHAQWASVAEPQLTAWFRANRVRMWQRPAARRRFMEEVGEAIENPNARTYSPEVRKVAAEQSRIMQEYVSEMKAAGVPGAENLQPNPRYFAKYLSPHRTIKLLNQLNNWEDLIPVVRNAIKARVPGMAEPLLERFARGYTGRLTRAQYGMAEDFGMIINTGDETAIRNLLTELKIDGEEADTLVQALTRSPKASGSKAQELRHRSKIDYNLRTPVRTKEGVKELAVRDLFEKDAETVFGRYARTMSGRMALADTQISHPRTGELIMDGIRTQGDWERVKNFVRDNYQQMAGGSSENLRDLMERLDYVHRGVMGLPLHQSQLSTAGRMLRRFRDFNVFRLMWNMGLNQLQETAQVIGTLGARAIFRGMPSLRWVADEAGRTVPKNLVLRELVMFTGQGSDNLINRYSWRYADEVVGQTMGNNRWARSGETVDTALAVGKEVLSRASLMRWITGYQKQITMTSMAQRFADMAARGGVEGLNRTLGGRGASAGDRLTAFFKGKDLKRLRSVGLSDENLEGIFREMAAKAQIQKGGFRSGRLHNLNLADWDPTIRDTFLDAMSKWTNKIVQTNDISSMAMWMTKPLASSVFQFRSFVFNAWSKQLLHGLNHFDVRQVATWSMELGMGMLTYYLLNKPKSLAMGDAQREEFDEKFLTTERIIMAGSARSTPASVLPSLVDSAITATRFGNPLFDNIRASGTASDFLDLNASMITDPFLSLAMVPSTIQKAMTEDRPMSQSEIRQSVRSFPGHNWMPIATLLQYLISDRPERKPRD